MTRPGTWEPVPRCRAAVLRLAVAAGGVFVGKGIMVPPFPAGQEYLRMPRSGVKYPSDPRKPGPGRGRLAHPLLYWMIEA